MQIEQIDRDAAAKVHERSCYEIVRIQGAQCRNGYGDTDPLVLDFAAHRIAALSARPDDSAVERIVDAVIDAANIVSHDGYYEIDRDAATQAAIAALGQ